MTHEAPHPGPAEPVPGVEDQLAAWREATVRDLLRAVAVGVVLLLVAFLPFGGQVRPYVFVLSGGSAIVLWLGAALPRLPYAARAAMLVGPFIVSALAVFILRGPVPIAVAGAVTASVLAALAGGTGASLCIVAVSALGLAATVVLGPVHPASRLSPRDESFVQAVGSLLLLAVVTYAVVLVLRRVAGSARDSLVLVQRLRDDAVLHERAVAAMEESEERFRLAFKTSPDAFSVSRLDDSTFLAVNDGFLRVYGWSEDEVLGKKALDLGLWQDPAERLRIVSTLVEGGEARRTEVRQRRKDGQIRTMSLSMSVFVARDGTRQVLSAVRDVTDEHRLELERKRLREQFAQAQKIEAVGRLAGGVAHEFNNLLTSIGASAGYLGMGADRNSELAEVAAEMEASVERGTQLTRQLLAFTQRQVLQPRAVDVNALLGDMRRVLERVLGENVKVVLEPSREQARVLADPGQLHQVLLNLVVNARDAMPKGGRILLATSVHPPVREGTGEVVIEVVDEGPGIPPDVMEHLFEPFFSTKEDGTGLGLASVYGIVKQHRGDVEVDPGVGRGATFRVRLPAAHAVEPGEVAVPGLPPRGQGQHVMLVDDEATVRRATARLLERLGYHVTAASSGEEALGVLAGGARLDLLVTDVAMPGMNGPELALEVITRRPGTPVLFVSGYSEELLSPELVERGGRLGFLPKPYALEVLAEKVRELLAVG